MLALSIMLHVVLLPSVIQEKPVVPAAEKQVDRAHDANGEWPVLSCAIKGRRAVC